MGPLIRFFQNILPAVACITLLAGCGSSEESIVLSPSGGAGVPIDASILNGGASSGGGGAMSSQGGANAGGANAGGANVGGSQGGSGGGGATCAALTCTAPATCSDASGTARCICPTGYLDTNADGSACNDIDECQNGTALCDPNATCTNTPGSFECVCNAPGWTESDGGTCVCAAGFKSVGGDCLKEDLQTCTNDDQCADGHCVGGGEDGGVGTCCAVACDSPNICQNAEGATCPDGLTCKYLSQPSTFNCAGNDKCSVGKCFQQKCTLTPKTCTDNNVCTTDSCNSSTGACVHATASCDDGDPCTKDNACDAVKGCVHTDNDGATCDDGDPCTGSGPGANKDTCTGGDCQGTPMNCSAKTDDCNTGSCVNGVCQAKPKNSGGVCNDGLSSCDAAGKCSAAGKCNGDAAACGALATSCSPTAPRTCTCKTGDTPVNGVCVPNTCTAANPCDPLATCSANGSGTLTCVCPKGYTGDGKKSGTGCKDINECTAAKNPCGPGVCTNTAGAYTCNCAGYDAITTASGPTCVCDLSGSYALIGDTTLSWPGTADILEGGTNVPTRAWSLRYQTVSASGTMTVETVPCGATTPDICDELGDGLAAIAFGTTDHAHAQYQQNKEWGNAKIDQGFLPFTMSVVGIVPNANTSYVEPLTYSTMGIHLANPAGAWPACAACVGQTTCKCPGSNQVLTVTNAATWVSPDGAPPVNVGGGGVGIFAVPGAGLPTITPDSAPITYGTSSPDCSRSPSGTQNEKYTATPGASGLTPFSAYEIYGASRVTSQLKSTKVGADCSISGTATGPGTNGQIKTDARFGACVTCSAGVDKTGNCTAGDWCLAGQIGFYDSQDQVQQVTSAKFTLKKLAVNLGPIFALPNSDATKQGKLNAQCAAVRAANCPPGKTCK